MIKEIIEKRIEESNITTYGIVKFGSKENLEKLQKGQIYCRNLEFYKSIEHKDKPFFDNNEGLSAIYQNDQISIKIGPVDGKEIILNKDKGLVGAVKMGYNFSSPVFCTFAINSGDWNCAISDNNYDDFIESIRPKDELTKFGEYACVFMNGAEFNKRLSKACKDSSVSVEHGYVHYVNFKEVSGRIPEEYIGFVKDISFKDESEYRYMFFGNELNDPFLLNVGDLSDITQIISYEDFIKGLGVDFSKENVLDNS